MSVRRSILYRTTQGSFTYRRPFSSFPWMETLLVRKISFHRSPLGRGEKVFYGKTTFHRSSIEKRPFMVLLRVEVPLPSLFFNFWKSLYECLVERHLVEATYIRLLIFVKAFLRVLTNEDLMRVYKPTLDSLLSPEDLEPIDDLTRAPY